MMPYIEIEILRRYRFEERLVIFKMLSFRYREIENNVMELVIKKLWGRASLVVQWLRICLPMQGTRVQALVWEDPTGRGATGPVSHSY